MESNVFSYFFAIGAGLAAGIAFVSIPALLLFNKLKNRGGNRNVRTAQR